MVALLPALRHPEQFLVLWLACAGSGALVLGPAWFGARILLPEWRSLAVLACGLGVALGPVTFLGRLIKTATHHRPLGAMTYAVVACVSVLCAWVLVGRLFQLAQTSPSITWRRGARLALAVLLLASFGIAALGVADLGSALAPVLIDGAALLALSMLGLKLGLDLKLGSIPPLLAWLAWGLAVGVGGLMSAQLGAPAATASLPLSAMAALFAQ
ncbi:MAG TPA: hypothetical protein VFZ61_09080 [Polyangiales bacterium]